MTYVIADLKLLPAKTVNSQHYLNLHLSTSLYKRVSTQVCTLHLAFSDSRTRFPYAPRAKTSLVSEQYQHLTLKSSKAHCSPLQPTVVAMWQAQSITKVQVSLRTFTWPQSLEISDCAVGGKIAISTT